MVHELRFNTASLDHVEFEFTISQHAVTVILSRHSQEEQEADHALDHAFCEAQVEVEPNDRVRLMFESLANNRLPNGSMPRSNWPHDCDYVTEEGEVLGNNVIPYWMLPTSMQSFLDQVSRELHAATRRVVDLLRWRKAYEGPHQPFSFRTAKWSFDNVNWHTTPYSTRAHIWTSLSNLRIDEANRKLVQELLDKEIEAPLSDTLYREAWEQRRKNPRSALLIGLSSLEVGVKHLIGERVPDASWLIEELPAPPLHRVFTEYIPKLTGQKPHPTQVTTIKKGI